MQSLIEISRRRTSTHKYESKHQEALSDKARILYSAPFRRLQNKAQVFSLEENAAIRSRLTHSLEVASVGRQLAEFTVSEKKLSGLFLDEDDRRAFVVFVENSCLMHDLGNPPFGHFCETTIKAWFKAHTQDFKESLFGKKELQSAIADLFDIGMKDFLEFDGNPQGFRIVTKLQFNHDEFGLNLTAAQLAGCLKYPWSPADKDRPKGKIGVFYSEREQLDHVRKLANLKPKQRHVIAYFMEASDDISYCMSDIEDAIEKRVISWDLFISHLKNCAASQLLVEEDDIKLQQKIQKIPAYFDDSNRKNDDDSVPRSWQSAMLQLRTSIARRLIRHCVQNAVKNLGSLTAGNVDEFPTLIAENHNDSGWPLLAIKDFSKKYLYGSRVVRKREITAYRVINGLLDRHLCLLTGSEQRFSTLLKGESKADADDISIDVEAALVSLLPRKYISVYEQAIQELDKSGCKGKERSVYEFLARCHLIIDFISGMTDDFALQTYQLLEGIKIDE